MGTALLLHADQRTAETALLVGTMRATASLLGGLFCRLFAVFLRLDVDDHVLFCG